MSWKKFFKISCGAIEFICKLGPSEEQKKRDAMQDIENIYDGSYFSGKMSKFSAECWKDYWANTIGIKRLD